jgi:hypothetical protein
MDKSSPVYKTFKEVMKKVIEKCTYENIDDYDTYSARILGVIGLQYKEMYIQEFNDLDKLSIVLEHMTHMMSIGITFDFIDEIREQINKLLAARKAEQEAYRAQMYREHCDAIKRKQQAEKLAEEARLLEDEQRRKEYRRREEQRQQQLKKEEERDRKIAILVEEDRKRTEEQKQKNAILAEEARKRQDEAREIRRIQEEYDVRHANEMRARERIEKKKDYLIELVADASHDIKGLTKILSEIASYPYAEVESNYDWIHGWIKDKIRYTTRMGKNDNLTQEGGNGHQ